MTIASISRRICTLILASLLAAPLHAQSAPRGAIHIKIVDQAGAPIVGAQIAVRPGTRVVVSDDDGTVTVAVLDSGTYTLAARRIGYEAATSTVRVRAGTVDQTITMRAISRQLDSVRVRARSNAGLTYSAIVLDFNGQAVTGAEVIAIGVKGDYVTDSLGRFTLRGLSGGTLAMRLRKIGYQATLTSVRMLADRADTLRMPRLSASLSKVEINERSGYGLDVWAYKDMDQRQRWKTTGSGAVSREELDAKGKQDLCDALPATPSGVKLGLHNSPFCHRDLVTILLDGTLCEKISKLSDYTADEVEMVEVFRGADWSGSLGARNCGGAKYVIWTRHPKLSRIVPKMRAIVGVVFDSIAQRPLARATVQIEDIGRKTIADSLGVFHFDSIASGVHALRVDHQTLADLGLLSLRDTVDLVPDTLTHVVLAIPSFATFWGRVCGDSMPRASDGLVYGRVLLGPAAVASSDTSGTVVEASWRGLVADSASDADSRKQVPADSAGNYAVCGAPTSKPLTLSAVSHGTATLSVSFQIGDVRIARRDLMLPASDIIDRLTADSSSVPPLPNGEGATLSGFVRDSLGKPLSDAHIAVTGVTGEWRTNEKGSFVARGIPSGARVVTSAQLGFLPERRLVDLADADSIGVDLSMTRVATILDTLKVSGKQSPKTTTLLDIVSRRKLGLGYAADSTKLIKLPGAGLRDAFNFPSVRTTQGRTGLWAIYMTDHARSIDPTKGLDANGCQPKIYVDGTPSDIQIVNDMSKEEIGLIEVFTSPSRTPIEYAGSGGNCGTVLLWRKRYLRP